VTAIAGGVLIVGAASLAPAAGALPDMTTRQVGTTPAQKPAAKATFTDTFSGHAGAAPSNKKWNVIDKTRPPTAWELENYRPAAAVMDGKGHLKITATRDAGGNWQSGRIETAHDFAAGRTGKLRVSANIWLPAGGKGYWPAFWMLGSDIRTSPSAWPANGEIDVMEHLGGNESASVHATLHCGTLNGGVCGGKKGLGRMYTTPDGSSLETGFHRFDAELDQAAGTLTWFIDGQAYHQVTRAQLGTKIWNQATAHGFYLIVNVAIGGWAGNPDNTTKSGVSMLVDDVSVYAS
jgi:beta-glucanase (GH16 family)